MTYVLLFIGGVAAGGIVGWVLLNIRIGRVQQRASAAEAATEELRRQIEKADEDFRRLRAELDAARMAKVKAETQFAEASKNLEEQKQLLEESKLALSDTFKALSSDALKSNNEAFLSLAKRTLDALLADGKGDLSKRQQAIESLLKPLGDSLKQYEQHVKELDQHRREAYAGLQEQVKALNETHKSLRDKTESLVTALRRPEVRGRWGELGLKRVAELAGMSEHCDFTEQVSVAAEEGRLRPDMVVHLPAGREIVVDAKVSLDSYLDALNAATDEAREALLQRHAQQMRTHMNRLAAKSYWEQFPQAPEFAVMFIPGESFFAAAVDRDRALIEDGMQSRVVLATPTTLIALLRAVSYGWRQEQVSRNAQAIYELGKQLFERLSVLSEHLRDIRQGLEKANEAYNKAAASIETRVFPAARRFKDLGVSSGKDIETIEPVDTTPRALRPPEAEEKP